MTGLERCLAVLRGEKPYRIPVVPMMTNFAVQYGGCQTKDVLHDADKLADCLIRTCEDFELDGLDLALDTAISPEALGAKVSYRGNEPAVCVEGAITDYGQVKDLPMIDPQRDGRIPVYLKTIELVRKKLGDHVLILNSIGQGPFSMACMVRGMEEFMVDLALRRLIDHCEQCLERIAHGYCNQGTHLVSCGDSMASSDVVSPEMYEQLAHPSEKKLAEYVKTLDIYFGIHICGNNGPLLSKLVETGADMLDVDYKTDLALCHDTVDGRAVVRGTIDPSSVLRFGNSDMVDEMARKNIEMLGQSGRFFLSGGCGIGRGTPHENIHAMVDAAKKYSPSYN